MSDSFWAAVVAGVATLLVPVIVALMGRDERDGIQKELSILKQLNPASSIYSSWEERVKLAVVNFAVSDYIRKQYFLFYRRYIMTVLFGAFSYLVYLSGTNDGWNVLKGIAFAGLIGVLASWAVSILYFLVVVLWREVEMILMQFQIEVSKRKLAAKQREAEVLSEIVEDTKKSATDLENHLTEFVERHHVPVTEEGREAEVYDTALIFAMDGYSREQVIANRGKGEFNDYSHIINEAFDYFEEWSKSNAPLQMRWRGPEGLGAQERKARPRRRGAGGAPAEEDPA
ncbi:hypothetical protein QP866_10595 [Corynebacterium imitans]|uniref:hypothetical protein n=1 Tax=Corynebacterium imitans TaxID=156978 RepID=UPI00254A6DD7|nr:hypothetical protein [Corynebacterium imitans]MDK8306753.1 hypothetical protein [Corynebacterium imitans]MDK8638267.1 hypothetical protein [Corynebacterium imitans]MDK8773346.1 hypothetical protein [Corynebacterium imitans]